MHSNWIILVAFSFVALLVIRGYMGLAIRLCLSKKDWRRYKSEAVFIDRWFFLSAPQRVKDKYSKYEKRIIRYTSFVKLYRSLNIAIHLFFLFEVIAVFFYIFDQLSENTVNYICMFFLIVCVLSLIIIAIAEISENRRYHRSRYR